MIPWRTRPFHYKKGAWTFPSLDILLLLEVLLDYRERHFSDKEWGQRVGMRLFSQGNSYP